MAWLGHLTVLVTFAPLEMIIKLSFGMFWEPCPDQSRILFLPILQLRVKLIRFSGDPLNLTGLVSVTISVLRSFVCKLSASELGLSVFFSYDCPCARPSKFCKDFSSDVLSYFFIENNSSFVVFY